MYFKASDEGKLRQLFLKEVRKLAGEGKTYKQIAKEMGVSRRTFMRWQNQDETLVAVYTEGAMRLQRGSLKVVNVNELRKEENKECSTTRGDNEQMRIVDLTGVTQRDGKLTAIRLVRVDKKQGAIWECLCTCGNTRDVPTKKFIAKRGAMRSCTECIHPTRRRAYEEMMGQKVAQANDPGPKWGIEGFAERWQELLQQLTPEQELLFEVICNGRSRKDNDLGFDDDEETNEYIIQMEALDWVLHTRDIEFEMQQFNRDRVERAKRRLRHNEGGNNE